MKLEKTSYGFCIKDGSRVLATSLGIECAVQDYNRLSEDNMELLSKGKYAFLIMVNKECIIL